MPSKIFPKQSRSPQRWRLFLLLWCAAIAMATNGFGDELGRGNRWVRKYPLTTMALTIIPKSCNPEQYKAANLTTTLAWKERTELLENSARVGLPWHLHLRPVVLGKQGLTEELKNRLRNHYASYKGCTGWLVWDEPNRVQMQLAAETIQWLKETWPETLVYSNAFPRGATLERYYGGELPPSGYSYEQYLRDFSTIMDSDVVMYDAYIFREGGGTGNLFPTMMTARKVALEQRKPYWSFVQSHADARRGYRMPSESDIRMQVFAHLTSGFTGIGYFTYEDQQGPALISNATLERRPLYYHIARLNREAINLGQSLRYLTSTDVRYVAGRANPVPSAINAWKPGIGDRRIKSIAILGSDDQEVAWRDLLIGFFKDDHGGDYFMLTNLWHNEDASAAERAITVTLTLESSVRWIGRLARETGKPESLVVTNGQIQITLPGGTGELMRIDNAEFPGLGK